MTSINALTDNHFAYMTADRAIYDCATGRIIGMGSKAIVLEPLRMVIAFSGRWYGLEAAVEALDRHCPVTILPKQADILAAVVPAMRDLHGRSQADGLAADFAGAGVSVTIAMFDAEERRPRLFHAWADGAPSPATPDPFMLTEIPGIAAPPIGAEREVEVWPAGHLRLPRKELRRLLEIQRRVAVPHMANGCGLGGVCEFYRIGADGVHFDELIRFPEQVGDVLDGSLAGEHIPSRMDVAFAS
jgi:hypothetical protein